jgi:hypothetical protein
MGIAQDVAEHTLPLVEPAAEKTAGKIFNAADKMVGGKLASTLPGLKAFADHAQLPSTIRSANHLFNEVPMGTEFKEQFEEYQRHYDTLNGKALINLQKRAKVINMFKLPLLKKHGAKMLMLLLQILLR